MVSNILGLFYGILAVDKDLLNEYFDDFHLIGFERHSKVYGLNFHPVITPPSGHLQRYLCSEGWYSNQYKILFAGFVGLSLLTMIVACLMSVVDSDERMELNNRISAEFQLRHQMQTVNNVFSNSDSNSTLSSSSSIRSTRERPTTLKLSISIPDSLPDYNDLGIENNGKFWSQLWLKQGSTVPNRS